MDNRSDGTLRTLSPLQLEILNILDYRFWPAADIEAALHIDSTEARFEMYSALGLLRRQKLVSDVPSPYSGRLYMITERGMSARHDGRLRQLELQLSVDGQEAAHV